MHKNQLLESLPCEEEAKKEKERKEEKKNKKIEMEIERSRDGIFKLPLLPSSGPPSTPDLFPDNHGSYNPQKSPLLAYAFAYD